MRRTDGADRVVRLLDMLGTCEDPLGVREIARRLDVHPSTASRLLGTLAASRFVEREEVSGRYRLGARIVGLAAATVALLPVVSQARPELEHLSAVTSETANLAILDGVHVVYVDQVTPAHTVVMASWVGRRSSAHASSSGKVLIAFGDPRARQALLRGKLERLTPRTVTDPERLDALLDKARRQGYAAGRGELEDGLVTIAAPVLAEGRAVAAISVSGPNYRLPEKDQPNLARQVMDAAAAASHRMAGRR